MWKYIITWCLTYTTQDFTAPTTDKFGRTTVNNDLVYRAHLESECNHQFYIESSIAAWDFYNDAKKEELVNSTGSLDRGIVNVKLDSVKIKKE